MTHHYAIQNNEITHTKKMLFDDFKSVTHVYDSEQHAHIAFILQKRIGLIRKATQEELAQCKVGVGLDGSCGNEAPIPSGIKTVYVLQLDNIRGSRLYKFPHTEGDYIVWKPTFQEAVNRFYFQSHTKHGILSV